MSAGARVLIIALATLAAASNAGAQHQPLSDSVKAMRWAAENELESLAIMERKTMIPMRDGVHIAADVYYPKDASKKYPTIWVRTPYNFNYWDVDNAVPRDMTQVVTAIKRGYAFIYMQERGEFFSEGEWDVLGAPLTDGDDEIKWVTTRPWSSGKVAPTGCSSTAEWQLAVAARGDSGFAAFNPQGFSAGLGRVGPYYQQGDLYQGGAISLEFFWWFWENQKPQRPMFPANTSREDLVRLSKWWDLAPHPPMANPMIDWSKVYWTLPIQDMFKLSDGPKGEFLDSAAVAGGGRMLQRTPNDPAWYKGGLYHDNMRIDVPGLWLMSWYDMSVGPNLEAYNTVRRTAKGAAANQQWAIIAPLGHCGFLHTKYSDHTIVGERDMGNPELDYAGIQNAFFDRFLKGDANTAIDTMPKVRYYTMGLNKWQASETWPPKGAQPTTFFLSSGGRANTHTGDGALSRAAPAADKPDRFTYDPMKPVTSYGGNVCCMGFGAGPMDQSKREENADMLVYTTEPFREGMEVSGPMTVTLYVSSDAHDTDFSIKVLDVYPDGRAYNLDETIFRMRYRDGYDKPAAWMEPDKVYQTRFQPLTTSNYFASGHRLRIEVASSDFPRFDRNLNTGGRNYDEAVGKVAHNVVHHSRRYPSQITVSTVKK